MAGPPRPAAEARSVSRTNTLDAMTDRSDEIARRAQGNRHRVQSAELIEGIRALIGNSAKPHILDDPVAAADIKARAFRGYNVAVGAESGLVRKEWSSDASELIVDLLHAVSAEIGSRPVWWVLSRQEPQAVVVRSDQLLDNPLGFAALDEYSLNILDQDVAGGLLLTRHSHHRGPQDLSYTWELEAWGAEPWLSATARAIEQGQ